MKRMCCLLLALAAVCVLAGCNKEVTDSGKEETVRVVRADETLELCMDAVVSGEMGTGMVLGTDGKPAALTPPDGLAGAICRQVEYRVVSLEESGDQATAILEITAPDAVPLLYEALAGMESYDEAVFTQRFGDLLENDPATKVFTVTVELRLVDSQWCLVPNSQFSNAITGGLMDEYEAVRQSVVDAMTEGGEQE